MAIHNKAIAALNNRDYGHKNLLINGSFDVWQRGTSFSNSNSLVSMYCADHWHYWRTAWTSNISASKQFWSGVTGQPNMMRITRTAGDTTVYDLNLTYGFETIEVRKLQGKTLTLQFTAYRGNNFSAASNNLGVQFVHGVNTDSTLAAGFGTGMVYGTVTNVSLTTNFVTYYVTYTVPSNATQLSLRFYYTPTGTAGAADYFEIGEIQLEQGNIATPIERRPYSTELALCQRYYMKRDNCYWEGYAAIGYHLIQPVQFPVTMRVAPTVTLTPGTLLNISATSTAYATPEGFCIIGTSSATSVVVIGNSGTASYTAHADLSN